VVSTRKSIVARPANRSPPARCMSPAGGGRTTPADVRGGFTRRSAAGYEAIIPCVTAHPLDTPKPFSASSTPSHASIGNFSFYPLEE